MNLEVDAVWTTGDSYDRSTSSTEMAGLLCRTRSIAIPEMPMFEMCEWWSELQDDNEASEMADFVDMGVEEIV